jgi:hypothetical protein
LRVIFRVSMHFVPNKPGTGPSLLVAEPASR